MNKETFIRYIFEMSMGRCQLDLVVLVDFPSPSLCSTRIPPPVAELMENVLLGQLNVLETSNRRTF